MIISCGEALIDMVGEKDESGRDIFIPCPGGSPYNTAIAIGRILGQKNGNAESAFLSRLSTDFFGTILVRRLEQNNVFTDLIVRTDENTTLAFVKLEEGKEPDYIFYTKGAADRSLDQSDLPAVLPAGTNCIVFGSISLTLEPSATSIENFIFRERAKENSPVISLDPNVRPFLIPGIGAYVQRFEKWAAASDIVKISSADFDFIYPGINPEKGAEKLLNMGTLIVVLTLGEEGAAAFVKREGSVKKIYAQAYHPKIIDTIGAGDTFHGALLSWLEKQQRLPRSALKHITGDELYRALCFANKAAAIVCSRKGAEPPSLGEIEALV